jgi:gamma-glutamyl-gamma-aminobutyrate hydrolase PuuD
MRKRIKFVPVVLILLLCLAFTSQPAYSETAYENAILYRINASGVLEFNVTHTANIGEVQIVDKTGSGIVTIDDLKAILGTVDAPARVFGTDVGARTLGKAVHAALEIDENNNVVNLTITNVRERPVIGISWKSTSIGTDYVGFAEAFERGGAFAVFQPQVRSAEEARTVLSNLNGIFVTGGEDWHPALYGEGTTPHGSSGWNVARDISDINIMQQAIDMDVPLLGVCRGHQGFNISMGGGLIQDVPYFMGLQVSSGNIDQSRVTAYLAATTTHRVYLYENIIDANGNLLPYSGTGAAPYTTVNCDADCKMRLQVDGVIHSGGTSYHKLEAGENIGVLPNSKWLYNIIGNRYMPAVATAHHQSVNPEKLGNGVTIVAYSSDGIVEAIEHQNSLFALCVQWHPERDALGNTSGVRNGYVNPDSCNPLLGALVKYAGVHADDPYAEAEAFVKKLNGNKNELTVTVLEYYSSGDLKKEYERVFSIDNNAAGTYEVGPYKVYVDTKGNTQIRECYIIN